MLMSQTAINSKNDLKTVLKHAYKGIVQLDLFKIKNGTPKIVVFILRNLCSLSFRITKIFYWLLAPNMLMEIGFRHVILFSIMLATPTIIRSSIKPLILWIKFNIFLRIIKGKKWVNKYKILSLKLKNECITFKQYSEYASKLDEMNGLYPWRIKNKSNLYSYNKIYTDLLELSDLRRKLENNTSGCTLRQLMDFIRKRTVRNYCSISNPKLYSITKVGTKTLIEDWIDNICQTLHYIVYIDDKSITISDKIIFFNEIRHILGRSALCLSGGSTLGAYHGGVILSMSNNKLLPKIIAGSSIGAAIASLVCTKLENEYNIYASQGIEFLLDKKQNISWISSFYIRLRRFYQTGYLLDVTVWRKCVQGHIGDITFLEAYNKTGRILNITVSGSDANTVPRLLNYLTAPNVVIWSAVVASCCVPFVFPPQELYIKSSSNIISPIYLQGVTFSDGSIAHDLPMNKLSQLFNVNNFIVSQVNPHIVPILFHSIKPPIPFFDRLFNFLGNEFNLHVTTILVNLREFGLLKGLSVLNGLFTQKYTGDMTIVPDIPHNEYLSILSNPGIEYVLKCTKLSQQFTWKHLSRLQGSCAIEFTIDECLIYLKSKVGEVENIPVNSTYAPVNSIRHVV